MERKKTSEKLMVEVSDQNVEDDFKTLIKILKGIRYIIPGLNSISIISYEGIPIISILPKGLDEDLIAVLTATILSLAERAIHALKFKDLDLICIQSSEQYFIVFTAGKNAVLAVNANKTANLGFIFLECNKIREKIANII